jgi:hypothetical protein
MNDYAMVSLPVAALIIFVVLLKVLPWNSTRKERDRPHDGIEETAVLSAVPPPAPQEPQSIYRDIEPEQLVVRHLNAGRATLMVRHRARMRACTAHLVIWSGKKKRRIQDSYYDLGIIQANGIGHDIVEQFLGIAQEKIGSLTATGTQKQRRRRKSAAESAPEASLEAEAQASRSADAGQPAAASNEPAVSVEENQEPDPAVKMKRFPSVYRGVVLEMGMMPRAVNGGEITCFGVRYRTAEGVVDVVWGNNLRTAFRDAKAGLGDEVEIVKIGRKTVEERKAPMNLYKVAKIQRAA